jgi:hypothetical protein
MTQLISLRQSASIGLIVLTLSILSVQFTLKWNSISGVYEARSTGQVMPLVAGLGLLINVLRKLIHKEKVCHELFPLKQVLL